MLDSIQHKGLEAETRTYRVVILTLDSHIAGPVARAQSRLKRDFPNLELSVHAAAEWSENPSALLDAKAAIATADIVVSTILFLEEHVTAILSDLKERRDALDAFVGAVCDSQIVKLTKLGALDMAKPASGILSLLKKLRGSSKTKQASGEKQMAMLKRLPKILRLIPGKAQDLRAYFLCMQYWLGGSDDNIEAMVRFLISRYASVDDWRGADAALPIEYPEVGLYHPDLADRVTADASDLPQPKTPVGTVGILMMRSYVLAGDTAHYDAVIRELQGRGLRVLPAFAGGLDGRPAMDRYFDGIDVLLSLTGFSLVGGPAFNDSSAAVDALTALDVTYIAAHPLEFQTIEHWEASDGGLGPVETTMLIALPEIDGATNPTVFAGRHDIDVSGDALKSMAPCEERVEKLADRVLKAAQLKRTERAEKKIGIVLYGFPPNAGAVGTAAYLSVFESLWNTLSAMKDAGYTVDLPADLDALRAAVLQGNAETYGQQANVLARVNANDIVAHEPWLKEIEAQWGPAPGRVQADGSGVFVLGADLGNVVVGVQPAFGYEGDPMRLLFEKGFAPTHAFSTFYRWMREEARVDALLHFGMHGALEFMPGKQTGLGQDCWPDRLIGDLPNIYLYAANNPSEATIAKRRSHAVTISHLTPPLAQAGLYKGLAELKDSLQRFRSLPSDHTDRTALAELIVDQAATVDLSGDPDGLWLKLLETEDALITDGLHVVGRPMDADQRAEHLKLVHDADADQIAALDELLQDETEVRAILHALDGGFTAPVPGGDLIRSPDILPTGRNIHAFDPFRMPTSFAMAEGRKQADLLLKTHAELPRTVAMVLWGSDNIKSDGGPLAQALALIGATPRFDSYGRLSGADLIPLEMLGRPRIDVIVTLSGIFRDLLPLQTKLLAEACWLAAHADEPLDQNFVRAHALAYAEQMGVDLETAALRVFSNAEGAYGSNVNQLIDSGAWDGEDELADAYEARKSFAYGRNGKCEQNPALLQTALKDVELAYQNLESVELGVTTVDHYFDTLGGISRAVKRAKGAEAPVYIGDQTRGSGKVRTLSEQVALEARTRSLNPKFYEGLLKHGHEGVRQIEAHVTNTMGWSATTGQVDPWVYQRLTETFVLDEEMKRRLAELNPAASAKMANRLLEAHERDYWQPDDETLEALRAGAEELEDRLEGVIAAE
ncbi:MAG: magnesium chelatase subunit H [Pseudomonadota bacterium]